MKQLYKFYSGKNYLGEYHSLSIGRDLYKGATRYEYFENGVKKGERSLVRPGTNFGRALDTLTKQLFLN